MNHVQANYERPSGRVVYTADINKDLDYESALRKLKTANGTINHKDNRDPGLLPAHNDYESCITCEYCDTVCTDRSWSVTIIDWCTSYQRKRDNKIPYLAPSFKFNETELFWAITSWHWWTIHHPTKCCNAIPQDIGTPCERILRCPQCYSIIEQHPGW